MTFLERHGSALVFYGFISVIIALCVYGVSGAEEKKEKEMPAIIEAIDKRSEGFARRMSLGFRHSYACSGYDPTYHKKYCVLSVISPREEKIDFVNYSCTPHGCRGENEQ